MIKTINKIARLKLYKLLFHCSLDRYESKGFKFLKDLPRSGRPCILDDSQKKL
ncbi:MAG: helix-turn-helix domain-containing protein [Arcicella sp.]|nr:helix-turn-helix domain-containing protein [Arcicella sp.]